jgi:hypothetical protein
MGFMDGITQGLRAAADRLDQHMAEAISVADAVVEVASDVTDAVSKATHQFVDSIDEADLNDVLARVAGHAGAVRSKVESVNWDDVVDHIRKDNEGGTK